MKYPLDKIIAFGAAILIGIAALSLLAADSAAETAGGDNCACHVDKAQKTFAHQPVKDGGCHSCHKPAGPKHPKFKKEAFQLVDGGKAGLCAECHERKDTKKHVHPPVAEGNCIGCHDPHQSDNKFQLKESGGLLCYTCHDKTALDRPFPHLPIAEGKCLGCHDPHQTNDKYMLKALGADLCMTCHKKEKFSGRFVHAPVAAGNCTDCHQPHGGKYRHLLALKFSDGLYQSFDKANYALCFNCHADTLADNERTDTETKFRNGIENLHYVHVNKAAKGRSCKVCHDVHSASQPRLISAKTSGFGRWRIPIRYTMTKVGGTCVVGCHKPKSYDRINPVENP